MVNPLTLVRILALVLYGTFACLDIRNIWRKTGNRFFKPFLMPLLAVYLLSGWRMAAGPSGLRSPVPWLMAAGILCGFAGDTLLIGDKHVTAGLGAFLTGHLFYIAGMCLESARWESLVFPGLLVLGVYAVYGFLVLRRLLPHLDRTMKGPVFAYMGVLIAMSVTASARFGAARPDAFFASFLGSVLFVLSDTILAFQLFLKRGERSVMETYVLAQFLIAQGMILQAGVQTI